MKVCDKTCIFCFFPIINKYLCMAKRSLLSRCPLYIKIRQAMTRLTSLAEGFLTRKTKVHSPVLSTRNTWWENGRGIRLPPSTSVSTSVTSYFSHARFSLIYHTGDGQGVQRRAQFFKDMKSS